MISVKQMRTLTCLTCVRGYFVPGRDEKCCDKRVCLSVCLSLCLPARMSQKPRVKPSRNFLYMLPVAVTRSSSDDNAMRYVLPVLLMMSCECGSAAAG